MSTSAAPGGTPSPPTRDAARRSASRSWFALLRRSPGRHTVENRPDTVGEVGGTPPKACIPRLPAWARQPRAARLPLSRATAPTVSTRFLSVTRLGPAMPRNGPEPVTGTPDGSEEWWDRGSRGFPPPTRRSDRGEVEAPRTGDRYARALPFPWRSPGVALSWADGAVRPGDPPAAQPRAARPDRAAPRRPGRLPARARLRRQPARPPRCGSWPRPTPPPPSTWPTTRPPSSRPGPASPPTSPAAPSTASPTAPPAWPPSGTGSSAGSPPARSPSCSPSRRWTACARPSGPTAPSPPCAPSPTAPRARSAPGTSLPCPAAPTAPRPCSPGPAGSGA